MTKGRSEGKVREALNQVDLPGLVVYKPPDDARNWKPCDYMLWWNDDGSLAGLETVWLEVKECPNVGTFPLAELRPAQRRGIAEAKAIRLSYLLVIWWPKRKVWTISEATQLEIRPTGSIPFSELAGRRGLDAQPAHLASILGAVLRGELRP